MRIDGEWYPCDDGFIRPIVHAKVRTGDGSWLMMAFLVDSGADQTTFAPDVLEELKHTLEPSEFDAVGIGGRTDVSSITTTIRLECTGGFDVSLNGTFLALTETGSLDMSILGRDVLNLFSLILDRENDFVTLINQQHRYLIVDD